MEDAKFTVGDPPVGIWILGLLIWLAIAAALSASSGWGPGVTLAVTLTGVLLGLTTWGPRNMTLIGHTLTVRTLWRRTKLDLRAATDATASGMSAWSSGELVVHFPNRVNFDISLRGPKNIRFAQEIIRSLDRLGRSGIVREDARRSVG